MKVAPEVASEEPPVDEAPADVGEDEQRVIVNNTPTAPGKVDVNKVWYPLYIPTSC